MRTEWAEGSMTLATILGDGSKDSGGRHEQNVSSRLIPAVQQIALELLNQYEITYTLPDGTNPSDRVSVEVNRDGVKLQAPSRIAN